MRCNKAKILISASMDGELSPREERELRRHVRRCAECAGEQAQVANLRDVMTVWSDEEPSEWLAERFAYKLRDEMERKPVRRRSRRPRRAFGAALAGFATALLAFGIILHSQLLAPEMSVPEKPETGVTRPIAQNPEPPATTIVPEPNSGRSTEQNTVAPRPPAPKPNTVVREPQRTPTVRPGPRPTPTPAVNTGPRALPRAAVADTGSRTRSADLASRGSESRDAEIKRMILRKLAMANSAENNTESTVAAQLAKADLTMNESVEEVRGLLRRAADNLARSDYRVDGDM